MAAGRRRRRLLLLFLLIAATAFTSLAANEDIHLIEFKESLSNTASLDPTWIRGTNPCDSQKPWAGIDCADTAGQSVSSILLMNHGLAGDSSSLDVEALTNLATLRVLSLENNSFSGAVPEFNRLGSLKSLFLGGNAFSGEIPPAYFDSMRSLKRVHLSRNKFVGKIPDSLIRIASLREVLLERNEFAGPIPSFDQKSLETIDLSYNKLRGEIPPGMARFPARTFEGNPDVCGAVINKPCSSVNADGLEPVGNESSSSGKTTKWAILGIVVAVLLVTILFKAKRKEPSFAVLGKENPSAVKNNNRAVSVQSPSLNRKVSNNKRPSGAHIDIESQPSKNIAAKTTNDLVIINNERGVFGLPDLMKAAAEVLGSGNLGSSYRASMVNGLSVVVKRMRHMNKLNRDAFDIEVRKLGRIRHLNILPPLAYHYRKEEKLMVSEYVPKGSLLLQLHGERGAEQSELNWPIRLKVIKGVARGMGFLHTEFANHELPHGNLKSSNILLAQNYEPLLTDYAMYSLISNNQSVQALSASKSPEAVRYQQLTHKSDVFCLGLVILEIMTRKLPIQYVSSQKGGTDVVQWMRNAISENRLVELIDPEIASNASKDSIDSMEKMLRIGAACTEDDHEQRIEMREAIRSIEEIQN
ncbi:pollen receptor-like kinase 3 [Andrographis paniculata]|uniref:pollen receptor-like kinase 3 n=1 Tax=Andrographis paniculata TaxID=175694 RepID=UPI0021E8DB70|nr:pollen receptor-like kinase 3 [Andrographis paniculata]